MKYYGKNFSCQKTVSCSFEEKEAVKFTFYSVCSKATGIISPWGTLTGIRPLSVYERLWNAGYIPERELEKRFLLQKQKINVLKSISDVQRKKIDYKHGDISVYLSIPFCPSKCSYCSFISISAVNKNKLLDQYLLFFKEEIRLKFNLIQRYGLQVKSLYIGGGTPGILSEDQLKELLESVASHIDLENISEKCFELGRPDTVSPKKLEILSNYGFDRICINTQTTCDAILKKVNRHHSSHDYFNSVLLAKRYDFKSINTDLIAGLPGESVESFKKSVEDVISTSVDNITIHTLAIKKSAKLAESDEFYSPLNSDVDKMINYAYSRLEECGYIPYYIYRQKNCVANGENIGFCKPDTPCLYNIYMMEDVHTIIACGAGASSKIIKNTTVQRVINVKYPMDYVSDFNKIKNNVDKIDSLLKEAYEND